MAPIVWPRDYSRWWWMRWRIGARGKWRVTLVEFLEHDGTEYVRPLGSAHHYPEGICQDQEASFVTAVPPPVGWRS